MNYKACLVSITLLACMTPVSHATLEFTDRDAENMLVRLDNALARRQSIISRRQSDINRMVDSLRKDPDNQRLILDIAERYTAFNTDSALTYLSKGYHLAEDKEKYPFMMRRAGLMPLTGAGSLAVAVFDSIPADEVPDSLRALYLESGRQMYSYLAAFSRDNSTQKAQFARHAHHYQKRLLDVLPKNSPDYRYHQGEYYFERGETGKARTLLEGVFETEPLESNLRARAAHHLATLARRREDNPAYIYYLAQAAIADVSTATREVAALQELGNKLYEMKDVDRSYNYLTEALANAVECGASLRMVESSRLLPIIERAKSEQIAAKQRIIYAVLGLLVLLIVGLILLLRKLRYEMKAMRALQDTLRQANRTKEVYISQFLSLCSIYMDKLNQFCKIANRKITAGKVDDLYRLTKSGKFVEEQSKEFYEVFDHAFLHLYPDFVKQVNSLLLPDQQIELKEGELLNTDLRILAFMRLGIEESTRIAQVLNYSINTIYAYRNRTKARAKNRETFEDDIMKISSDS